MQITNTINNTNTIINYLQQLPLKDDSSSYSKGRLICWINKEPLLILEEIV
jgi:hypothetical protein